MFDILEFEGTREVKSLKKQLKFEIQPSKFGIYISESLISMLDEFSALTLLDLTSY